MNWREGIAAADWRGHACVFLLALALFLPASWWGAPHATGPDRVNPWGTDDAMPMVPLAEIHGVFKPDPSRNLGYPLLHPFLVGVFYAPYMAWLFLTGQISAPSGAYPFGLANPVGTLYVLTLIARLVSLLCAAGVVVCAYDAAGVLWDRRRAIWAAAFAAVSFPMFYYSRTGNPDIVLLFFTAAALAAYGRILVRGFTPWRAAWLGIFGGAAVATKEQAAASFILIPVVLLWLSLRAARAEGAAISSWNFWKPFCAAAGACLAAFALGSGLLVDPQRFFAHMDFARQRMHALSTGDVAFFQSYPNTWVGNFDLAQALLADLRDCINPWGAALAVAGLVLVIKFRESHVLLFLLPAVSYLAVLFTTARVAQLRYLMPVAFSAAFLAARAATLDWGKRSQLGKLTSAFTILALASGLLQGADLTYAMLSDTRYAAARWLDQHLEPGDAIDYFGANQKLPPLPANVTTARPIEFRGAIHKARTDESAVREILASWERRKPGYVLIIPDHSSAPGIEYPATCPPVIFEGLITGEFEYRLAAEFQPAPLFSWLYRPPLDYPTVSPAVRIFRRVEISTAPEKPESAGKPAVGAAR